MAAKTSCTLIEAGTPASAKPMTTVDIEYFSIIGELRRLDRDIRRGHNPKAAVGKARELDARIAKLKGKIQS